MVINGMISLRAYRKFDFFRIQFMEAIEKSANSTFCYIFTNRWVGVRLDSCCIIFGISTAAFSIFSRDYIDRELLTFSLQIISDVLVFFSLSVRMAAEVQNMMVSSQRIYAYTQMDSEDLLEK